MWKHQIPVLVEAYRCITITMPLYNDDHHVGITWRRTGYSFDELCDMLRNVVVRVDTKGEGVGLVLHDFGSIYGFYFLKKYPELVRACVTFDIGNVHGLLIGEEARLGMLRNLAFYGLVPVPCAQLFVLVIPCLL